jgi:GntR family transcriptional regulator
VRGQLRPGDRLPTERAFCERLGVSRATVRRALRQLAYDGLVEATVGRGSFVTALAPAEPLNELVSFTELAASLGKTASAKIMLQTIRPARPEETRVFNVGLHDLIFDLERMRMMDQAPVALDHTGAPLSIAPSVADQHYTTASIFASAGAGTVRRPLHRS